MIQFYNYSTLMSIVLVFALVLPMLIAVAFITVFERKVLASLQRRVGPDTVGIYGTLQAFSDAAKLLLKEVVVPQHATKSLFYIAPIISLYASILGWGVIPFGSGLAISDSSLGVLYSLAISSIGTLGVFLAGWAANSKYAFLGSLRSTAQIISYELILGSVILAVIFISGSLHFTTIMELQESVWYVFPLVPLAIIFFISALAELNRTPFDLVEAESELVSGYFTEHSSVPFVFFFLAEYNSIVLIATLTAIYFFGGFVIPQLFLNDSIFNIQSIVLGFKACVFCFVIVWVRGALPRLRYDQLIGLMWMCLLPIVIGILILVPSLLITFVGVNIIIGLPFTTNNNKIIKVFINNIKLIIRFFAYRYEKLIWNLRFNAQLYKTMFIYLYLSYTCVICAFGLLNLFYNNIPTDGWESLLDCYLFLCFEGWESYLDIYFPTFIEDKYLTLYSEPHYPYPIIGKNVQDINLIASEFGSNKNSDGSINDNNTPNTNNEIIGQTAQSRRFHRIMWWFEQSETRPESMFHKYSFSSWFYVQQNIVDNWPTDQGPGTTTNPDHNTPEFRAELQKSIRLINEHEQYRKQLSEDFARTRGITSIRDNLVQWWLSGEDGKQKGPLSDALDAPVPVQAPLPVQVPVTTTGNNINGGGGTPPNNK